MKVEKQMKKEKEGSERIMGIHSSTSITSYVFCFQNRQTQATFVVVVVVAVVVVVVLLVLVLVVPVLVLGGKFCFLFVYCSFFFSVFKLFC